jgi:UPF0176 protein
MNKKKIFIYAFYRFINLKNLKSIKDQLEVFIQKKNIYGTILIASEGINGTISGQENQLIDFIKILKSTLKIRKLPIKITKNEFVPFYRMRIRLKKEIVTIGKKTVNPENKTGKYISPRDWDKIINSKDYVIFDTRNKYEIDIGSFKNSKKTNLNSFREFPKFIKKQKFNKNQKIAMFCTGGIRCEKASSYLIDKGYKNIFQLEGGILNYLEYKKNYKSTTWEGECFVFDNRVAVNKKLKRGRYDQCYGCRHPITKEDKKLKSFINGVSCKYCINKRSERQINASLTRQRQIDLAEKKRVNHPFRKIKELI